MKSKPLNIRLPNGMKERLEDFAYALDMEVTQIVTEAVAAKLAALAKELGDVPPRPSRVRESSPEPVAAGKKRRG
jgi:hypothetical protein